jgi:hypothetical protein
MLLNPSFALDRPVKKNIFVNLTSYDIPNTLLFNSRETGSLKTIETHAIKTNSSPLFTTTLLAINKHEISFYARQYKVFIFEYLSSGRVFALPVTADLSLQDMTGAMHLIMQKNPSDVLGFLSSSYFFEGSEYTSMSLTCSVFLKAFRQLLYNNF